MIELYTAATPNGHKVSIALEEMALPYQLHALNLSAGEQKSEAFLRINPNGRIPAIIDRDNDDFALAESGAILIYLAEKSGQFLPTDDKGRFAVLQWLMFQMSAVGPMFGQASVFVNYLEEKVPVAIERYVNESRRLLEVMERQLAVSDYLAGAYSIADMATYDWALRAEKLGIDTDDLPHFRRWRQQIGARPAVQRGMNVPPQPTDEERTKRAQSLLTK